MRPGTGYNCTKPDLNSLIGGADMIAETMIKPSSWINQGIVLRQVENFNLFKFSDELQDRLDELNDRLKTLGLSESEKAEWLGLLELDQIFTLLNAKVLAG
jgi:hypothetical protein